MKKTMIYPGSFDPFHLHHFIGLVYFGNKYRMERGIIIPSYSHPEKNNKADFEKRVEIIDTWLKDTPLGFPVDVSLSEKETGSTGKSIIDICRNKNTTNYLLLGLDTLFEKFRYFDDNKKIMEMVNLIVNDYDHEIVVHESKNGETYIQKLTESMILPTENVILDSNPFSGLHSSDIRQYPEAHLNGFPKNVRRLIEKYYME
ncbi:MAG: hypothetical protein JW754_04205 [Candidatus Aenigmarchaeota archaeon]|nr:hypothetical protein [Candidatus Aenigmarchaeota archaeon]